MLIVWFFKEFFSSSFLWCVIVFDLPQERERALAKDSINLNFIEMAGDVAVETNGQNRLFNGHLF